MTAIRRNIKNMVHNYSDAKVKVREATSNDPWGPSSTLMAEIAEMTYNVMAYTEIMSLIWKRLNDKNRNWRHVYKALVLLDYLVKTGSEKVAQQCKENLFVVQSLRDFQYVEEAKDHGLNVREKAKQLVALLKDDEKLRAERASALRTRERLHASGTGGGRPPSSSALYRRSGSADFTSSAETAGGGRMYGASGGGGGGGGGGGAEDVELELALAMSREEHAEELKRREAEGLKDDMKLRMAMEASKKDEEERQHKTSSLTRQKSGGLVDLIDTSLSAAPANGPDPWGSAQQRSGGQQGAAAWNDDPWASQRQPPTGNGGTAGAAARPSSGGDSFGVSDPWSSQPAAAASSDSFGGADGFGSGAASQSADPWFSGSSAAGAAAAPSADGDYAAAAAGQPARAKSAQSFLGDHGNLVNLDSLVVSQPKGSTNPFAPAAPHGPSHPSNPFYNSQPTQPTLSELQRRAQGGFDSAGGSGSDAVASGGLPPPLIQAPRQQPSPQAPGGSYPVAYNPWGPPQQPPPMPPSQQAVGGFNNSSNPFL